MPEYEQLLKWLGLIVVIAPVVMVVFLGVATLLKINLRESTINRYVEAAMVAGLLASVSVLVLMLISGIRRVPIDIGAWFEIPHFHYSIVFVFDRLSVPFAILSYVLGGTIGAFSSRYMHRERGYNRFFTLYSLFVLGMVVTSLAGTIQALFAGWELVGLSSALLVAYYQERPGPVGNGLWVWCVYRVSDAALLLAAVVLHHMSSQGDFHKLMGGGLWPLGEVDLPQQQVLIVGLLLLLAAAGKSGLIPFSGWLPRAMEGPTPSSAVFYGALSVHLGAFLLLRVGPLLNSSVWLSGIVVVLGLTTAVYAYLAGSVQTDIKAALSFACLSQVGIIVAEIGFGLRYIALIHLLGHACLRTMQFIRAPTLLHDYHTMENAIGDHLPRTAVPWGRLAGGGVRTWLYRLGLERGYLDYFLAGYVVAPFIRVFRWCDAMERRWTDFLTGDASRESNQVKHTFGTIEELL
jgi:NAD(P)H-quinone oxidoreductase subunit 5